MNAEIFEELWEKVLAAALLGTDRQPFELPQAEGALGDLFKHLDPSDPEGALLSVAAALGYMRRAGRLPIAAFGRALPPPCPPDPQPVVPRQAAALLAQLDAGRPYLLQEWLRLAFQHSMRAPEEYLPELLTLSASCEPALGALVVGVRGRWLAALLGGQWAYAAFQLEDDSAWRTGKPTTRTTYLGALRLIDPERGRRLLEETWERESAGQRAALLEALSYNLSEADLPFLSRIAQTDGTLSVRETATDLINQLTQVTPSPQQREADVLPLFKRARPWLPSEYAYLARCDHAWSAPFSLRFAEYLPHLLAAQIAPNTLMWLDRSFPDYFEALLVRIHPEAIGRVLENLEALELRGAPLQHVTEWRAILRFRAALHAAFRDVLR
ncbi:MAG: DUF5691 domain-containing protein [Aggregatilineales bacterium]